MKFAFCALAIVMPFLLLSQHAPAPFLTAGPFAGAVTDTSAKIWISVKGKGTCEVHLQDTIDKTNYISSTSCYGSNSGGDSAIIYCFSGLRSGRPYAVMHNLRTILSPDCVFFTQTDTPGRDIDFLTGSCALMNTDITRILLPGTSSRIFRHMAHTHADFMVWLGDNIYYLGDQYKTYQNMFDRNLKIRRRYPVLNNFLASMPQYAIWDDHDFGPNDADDRWIQKDSALMIFKTFWPNPYEDSIKANYFSYSYQDIDIYMTDDRMNRDPEGHPEGAFLGHDQLQWLKAKLKKSSASFKFLCVGSQVLNDNNSGESYANYPVERNDLINFIVDNNIKGVVFITGDKHYAELSKRDIGGYTFYDFTASPLTSPMDPRNRMNRNQYRIDSTVYYHKNFGRVQVNGPKGARVCTLSLYNKDGKQKWSYAIREEEAQTHPEKVKVEAKKH